MAEIEEIPIEAEDPPENTQDILASIPELMCETRNVFVHLGVGRRTLGARTAR